MVKINILPVPANSSVILPSPSRKYENVTFSASISSFCGTIVLGPKSKPEIIHEIRRVYMP